MTFADKLCCWLARKLPHNVAYWAYIRVQAHASKTPALENRTMGSITCFEALAAWRQSK